MSRISVFVSLVAALALSAGADSGLVARQVPQRPTFQGGVDLVQLDVVVLDKNLRPVTGLTANDFTLLEDGQPRPIAAFSAVTLPDVPPLAAGTAAWTRDVAPDVVTNTRADEGRLVVIMMDRSIPAGGPTLTARKIAKNAVDALGPNDLAAVVHSSGFAHEGLSQNFTGDKARLKASIDGPFMGLVNPPAMTDGGLVDSMPDLATTGDCLCGLCVLEAMERVADSLKDAPGRQKTLLFLGSDILVYWESAIGGPLDCSGLIRFAREKADKALDRANVTVYSIDPTGLETLALQASSFRGGSRPTPASTLKRQGNLGYFPDSTGGRVITNTNAPEEAVPAIFAENRSYYLLAFEPRQPAHPGERVSARVRVNRKGVIVRSRTGYYAPERPVPGAEAPDPLAESVAGLLPERGLAMQLSLATRFAGDGAVDVSVLLGIGDDPALPAMVPLHAELLIGAYDEHASPVGSERVSLDVPALQRVGPGAFLEHGVALAVPPGRFEIRAGVRLTETGTSGSVFGYVDVPALKDDTLAVSGVRLAPFDPGAAADAEILRRSFARGERIAALLEIHRGDRPVSVRARIVDAHDREALTRRETLDRDRFGPAGIASYRLDLPLRELEPGEYLLSLDAADGRRTDHRDVRFAVTPDR